VHQLYHELQKNVDFDFDLVEDEEEHGDHSSMYFYELR